MGAIKKILFPLFLMGAVVGGAVAADFVRNQSSVSVKDKHADSKDSSHKKKDSHSKADSHDKKDSHGKPKKPKKDKGHGKEKDKGHGSDSGSVTYLKFKRQFVVPVMDKNKIEALVIMNLNLELNDDAPDNAYSLEPKLRDAIMRELLVLSSDDIFGANLTSAESYQTLRSTLLRASKAVISEGVEDILILDIARQDQ
ncbi:MAG: hypothetical protein ACSHXY_02355 [Alphaproteobacteria bacterium]